MELFKTILDSQLPFSKLLPKFAKRFIATIIFNRVDAELKISHGHQISNTRAM